MNPKISVIVPVYNVEKYLHRCIDSIFAQTFTGFELLLIDDGSKDKSGEICDEYARKDARVRVFHKANGGVSSARNVGLDNAKGEYICFCDADDWVDRIWLEDFCDKLPCDMVVQGYKYQKVDDSLWQTVQLQNLDAKVTFALDYLFTFDNIGYLWCRCFKTSVIKEFNLKFNCDYVVREDHEFIIAYSSHIHMLTISSACGYNYYMPNFCGDKYKNINVFSDINCTLSIIKNLEYIYKKDLNKKMLWSEISRLQNNLIKISFSFYRANVRRLLFEYQKYKYSSCYVPQNLKAKLKSLCLNVLIKLIKNYV